MMLPDTSGITLGARAMVVGAERALLVAGRRADARFDAFLAGARVLVVARAGLEVFLALLAAAARTVLVDRPALFAECLLMFVNIAAYFRGVGSFLTNLYSVYSGLPDVIGKS